MNTQPNQESKQKVKGRGASFNPINRFDELYVEPDEEAHPDDLTQILHWKQGSIDTPNIKCCKAKGGITPTSMVKSRGDLTSRPFGRILH